MSEPQCKTYMLRVGIKRRYGDHEVYFEIAEQVQVSSGQARRDAFQNLNAQLEDQINVYEAVSLPHVKLPQGSFSPGASSSSSDTFPLLEIVIESRQGKRIASAVGGRWKKHGVPLYKECDTDIDFQLLDYGRHDFSGLGLTCTVEMEKGVAKRVRSIK